MRHHNLDSLKIFTMRHTKTHMLGPKDAWKEREGEHKCSFSFFLFNLIYAFLGHRSIVLTLDENTPLMENSELCSLNYPRLGEQVLILKMTEPDLVLQSPLPPRAPKHNKRSRALCSRHEALGWHCFKKSESHPSTIEPLE